MVTVKMGHRVVHTTLRPPEVTLLDDWTKELEEARKRRLRHFETYRAADDHRVTRAGMARAAIRYVLEHRAEFLKWLEDTRDAL